MNCLSRATVLITIASGALAPVVPPPALADPIGGLIIIPGAGTDLSPIRMRTSTGCPVQTSKYYAAMRGHGFPPDGQAITSATDAGLSTSAGFDVYFEQIMRDYAAANHTTLAGRYDITVHCTDSLAQESYGEFTGSMEFASPTTYQAIGTARLPASLPPALPRVGDDPVVAPDPISTLTALTPSAPAPVPGQLASQRGEMAGQRIPRLVVVLSGVALLALIAAVVTKQIRKRRTS